MAFTEPDGRVVAKFATIAADEKTYQVKYFNIAVIILVETVKKVIFSFSLSEVEGSNLLFLNHASITLSMKIYLNLTFSTVPVGYRLKSHGGTQFRIWATQRLREYIIKGFALDDERLRTQSTGLT